MKKQTDTLVWRRNSIFQYWDELEERGLRQYYMQHIHDLQLQSRQKTNNRQRLEAQRNDLNSRGAPRRPETLTVGVHFLPFVLFGSYMRIVMQIFLLPSYEC